VFHERRGRKKLDSRTAGQKEKICFVERRKRKAAHAKPRREGEIRPVVMGEEGKEVILPPFPPREGGGKKKKKRDRRPSQLARGKKEKKKGGEEWQGKRFPFPRGGRRGASVRPRKRKKKKNLLPPA